MDDIQQMREYVSLVELRSFTAVAKRYYLSQSTVSKRLKRIEGDLGVTLIDRGPKSVAPTEEGMVAYEAFRDIIARYDALQVSLSTLNREREGVLSIGVLYHGVEELATPYVRAFKKVCPNVSISYVPCQNYQVAQRLASEEIDVGFAGVTFSNDDAAYAPDSRFSYIPLMAQEERVATSPNSPLTHFDIVDPSILSDYTCVCVSDEGLGADEAKALLGCLGAVDARQVDMVPMMLAEDPRSFAILDSLVEKRFDHILAFRPLTEPVLSATYSFVRRKDDVNPLVGLFEKTVRELQ